MPRKRRTKRDDKLKADRDTLVGLIQTGGTKQAIRQAWHSTTGRKGRNTFYERLQEIEDSDPELRKRYEAMPDGRQDDPDTAWRQMANPELKPHVHQAVLDFIFERVTMLRKRRTDLDTLMVPAWVQLEAELIHDEDGSVGVYSCMRRVGERLEVSFPVQYLEPFYGKEDLRKLKKKSVGSK